MRTYISRNIVPLCIEIIFIISCFIVPKEYFIYSNFIFYIALLLYFILVKDFSMKEWLENLKKGKTFWKPVLTTVGFFLLAFVLTSVMEGAFPQFDAGTIGLRRDSWITLFLFAVSTIILPPIVEETFYRKNLILLENRKIMIVTTVFSMILYAAEHSLTVWGIALTMIWALPLSISYIKTKNVFVPMTAHFLVNLFGNGADVIFTMIRMM